MTPRRRALGTTTVAFAIIAVAVVGGVGAVVLVYTNSSLSANHQTTALTTCAIQGQPGPFFLRVVSDANQTPIAGAQVTATNQPASVSCNGQPPYLATNKTTLTFTTNNTEWYSLDSQNNAGYSLVVKYSGQSYNFTADLRTISLTCASLYIPSGKTNITITEFQTPCPP